MNPHISWPASISPDEKYISPFRIYLFIIFGFQSLHIKSFPTQNIKWHFSLFHLTDQPAQYVLNPSNKKKLA